MKLIKKLFPMAFTEKSDSSTLVVDIVLHLLFAFGIYVLGDLLTTLGAFGVGLAAICYTIDVYLIASAVFAILNYCKVIK